MADVDSGGHRRSRSRSRSSSRSFGRQSSSSRSRSPRGNRSPSSSSSSSEDSRSRRGSPAPISKEEKFALPPAPTRSRKEAPPQINIAHEDLLEFESLARGTFFPFVERESLLAQMPRINSALARLPLADKELKDKDGHIAVREQELRGFHDILLTTLNVSEMIRQAVRSNDPGTLANMDGYLELLRDLISGGIRDITVLRPERLFRALCPGISPTKAVPSIRRAPIDNEASVVHPVSKEEHPPLFGSQLRDEIQQGESPLARSLDKLRKAKRSSSEKPFRGRRNVFKRANTDTGVNKKHHTSDKPSKKLRKK